MAVLKAIIVDDEKHARELLKDAIAENCQEVEVVATADSTDTARELIKIHHPDVLFLDIEMPGETGLDFLNSFADRNFSVVFVTAYNQYAMKAIKAHAFDYLLKPIDEDELKLTVESLVKQHEQASSNSPDKKIKNDLSALLKNLNLGKNNQKITIPHSKGYKVIDINDIVLLEGNNNYTNVYLTDAPKVLSTKTLKEYETNILDEQHFFRAHKSYLINLSHITEFLYEDGGYVLMSNKMKIPIARGRSQILLQKINIQG